MIRYAYERGVKVQIVISFGNEQIINESQFTVNFDGVNVVSHIGEVIDPKDFKTNEDFYNEVSKVFERDYRETLQSYKNI